MERNNRERNFYGDFRNDRNGYDRDNRREYNLNRQFERNYQDHRNVHNGSDQDRYFDNDQFRNYRERDYNMEHDYYENMRGDQNKLNNIRQGYGISSFEGTSDRYNTLNDMQRERNAQEQFPHHTGRRESYSSSRFGSGMGDSSMHSNRGIPNYDNQSFREGTGTGMGSTYGGKNYGGGTGYSGGHHGGTMGNSSYGASSGNFGGYGTMGNGSHGASGSYYDRSSGNYDRGSYNNNDY